MRSYVPDYDLVIAKDLSDALELLASDAGWRPIAGGTDLMVLFNAGKLPFRKLVSTRDLHELRGISVMDDHVTIGAGVTYTQIRNSTVLKSEFPLLCQAASWTGGVANQNRGTLGGNVANASPAADSAPVLLVYNAELCLVSKRGRRWIPYRDFHLGYKQFAMKTDELILEFRLPRSTTLTHHYGRKVGTRKAQAISKVSIAVAAEKQERTLTDIRVALGSECCRAELGRRLWRSTWSQGNTFPLPYHARRHDRSHCRAGWRDDHG